MDDDTTIINVKGVRKAAWNAATRAAALAKTPYGPWLSDAIDQRLYREATGGNPEGKAGLTEDQKTARILAVAALAEGMASLKAARARPPIVAAMLAELAGDLGLAGGKAEASRGKGSVKPPVVLLESGNSA